MRKKLKVLSLFSGIGGFDVGLERAGMECVGQVEYNPFCQRILKKHWPHVKLIGDIHDVKGDEFGPVDLICGGFPCQPFSTAGKRKGTDDNRYLWPEMLRLISAIRPRWVIGENVRGLLSIQNGMVFEQVCVDMEGIGYEVRSFVIPACGLNSPHRRDRVWIIGHAASRENNERKRGNMAEARGRWECCNDAAGVTDCHAPDTAPKLCNGSRTARGWGTESANGNCHAPDTTDTRVENLQRGRHDAVFQIPHSAWDEPWIEAATRLCTLDDGLPGGLARPRGWRNAALKAVGNAVVPGIVEQIGRAITAVENSEEEKHERNGS